jgi:hypothetical protein
MSDRDRQATASVRAEFHVDANMRFAQPERLYGETRFRCHPIVTNLNKSQKPSPTVN